MSSTDYPAPIWQPAVPIGIGLMNWGNLKVDRYVIPDGQVIDEETLDAIVARALDAGVTFFDSAEGYSNASARLGATLQRLQQDPTKLQLASKFLPTFWRWTQQSFVNSLDANNVDLGTSTTDVWFIHTPMHPLPIETWVRAAAKCVASGKMRYLGLSNFNSNQVRRAVAVAKELNVPIAANQIQLNMLTYKSPKLQETIHECKKNGIAIVAYSSLAQGLLAKADMTEEEAKGVRLLKVTGLKFSDIEPLRATIKQIADNHPGHSMAHVCLAWTRAHGAVPLIGMRKTSHLDDALASLSLQLSKQEMEMLDEKCFPNHTFEKPPWRRSIFVFFISCLFMAYNFCRRFLSPLAARKKTS